MYPLERSTMASTVDMVTPGLVYDDFYSIWRAFIPPTEGFSCSAFGATPVEAIRVLKEKLRTESFKPPEVKELLERM